MALTVVALVSTPAGAAGAFDLSWPTAREAGLAGAQPRLAVGPAMVAVPAPGDSSERKGSAGGGPASRGPTVERVELSGGELYGLPEARGFVARGIVGFGFGSAVLTVGRLGGDLYRETTIGLALSRPIGRAVVAEVGSRLLSLGAAGVSERRAVAFDAGVASRVLGRILVAATWRNVGDARVGGSPVAAGSSFGAALDLDGISLAGSLDLDPAFGSSFAAGAEASVGEWLRLRGGVLLEPPVFAAGIGIGRKRSAPAVGAGLLPRPVVDLAVSWHPDLGGSTFVTITFRR